MNIEVTQKHKESEGEELCELKILTQVKVLMSREETWLGQGPRENRQGALGNVISMWLRVTEFRGLLVLRLSATSADS